MLKRVLAVLLVLAAFAVFAFSARTATVQASPPVQGQVKGDPTRGAYLFALNGGCGCHQGAAGYLAGGDGFDLGPAGKVYAKNITSDPETGIGNWTEQDIVTVFREGKTPDGELLFPVMPYPLLSGMSQQDQYDLAAYIKTVPPVKNAVQERALNVPVPPFTPREQPASAPTEGVERGNYLVNTMMICSDCHTPQGPQGPDMTKFLAGNVVDPDNIALNITPDVETGIGDWSEEQIYTELKTGKRPDGSFVCCLMDLQIQGGYKEITETDGLAVAAYLKTIPAVNNIPSAAPAAPPQTLPGTGTNPLNMPLLVGLLAIGGVLLLGGVVVWRTARK